MDKTIQYFVRRTYGNPNCYIVDQSMGNAHNALTGRKTIINSDFIAYNALGFIFEEVKDPNPGFNSRAL